MRVLLVYDCLFPHTIGGAERWYRTVALGLAAQGHEVTYLTLRQWDRDAAPDLPGVDVVVAGPRMALYVDGRRRIAPPLVFGAGVLWHLLRHGRRYDVVHTCSFPYFSLLAAGLLRRRGRYRLVVDWFELWSREYWLGYLGGVGGRVGLAVQTACLRVPQRAFAFARLTAGRLREAGVAGEVEVLTGLYDGPGGHPPRPARDPVVVYAGRHIPEKQVPLLVRAFALAREQEPALRLLVLGDGPDRPKVLELIETLGLAGCASAPGFVPAAEVAEAIDTAMCLAQPSAREGYGMVVVEASAAGVPCVVCDGPDNAAVELVAPGVNGEVAATATPEALAAAILAVHRAGPELRDRTARWFDEHAERLSVEHSVAAVAATYAAAER